MARPILTFIIGGLFGGGAGFAVGIFIYPYIFLADIVSSEQVVGADSKTVVATGTFIHADPGDPIHYGRRGHRV